MSILNFKNGNLSNAFIINLQKFTIIYNFYECSSKWLKTSSSLTLDKKLTPCYIATSAKFLFLFVMYNAFNQHLVHVLRYTLCLHTHYKLSVITCKSKSAWDYNRFMQCWIIYITKAFIMKGQRDVFERDT